MSFTSLMTRPTMGACGTPAAVRSAADCESRPSVCDIFLLSTEAMRVIKNTKHIRTVNRCSCALRALETAGANGATANICHSGSSATIADRRIWALRQSCIKELPYPVPLKRTGDCKEVTCCTCDSDLTCLLSASVTCVSGNVPCSGLTKKIP